MFTRDPFGHLVFLKRTLVCVIGWITWFRYTRYNKLIIEGTEHLQGLPQQKVLFISNHQTYFADVIAMLHVFCAHKNGRKNSIERPVYLFRPRTNTYFVAAEETMRKGWLPRLFAYVGAIPVQRTWRQGSADVKRQVRMDDISNIGKALEDGWVINFPQGTTKVYAQGRRGVTHLVKKYEPVVVPIVIDGFRRAFDKKGLRLKKKGVTLRIRFKPAMQLDLSQDAEHILHDMMDAIEQSPRYHWPRNAATEGSETK
ncbi:MAG: 1-acyl-sn-glycerol-3-phosphate acyltransferase [Bacteroidetes bacterium]|nr:1-acyl-sn-glycerol-3-phosphate acyltransferase [Bacteroidota bacterium]